MSQLPNSIIMLIFIIIIDSSLVHAILIQNDVYRSIVKINYFNYCKAVIAVASKKLNIILYIKYL